MPRDVPPGRSGKRLSAEIGPYLPVPHPTDGMLTIVSALISIATTNARRSSSGSIDLGRELPGLDLGNQNRGAGKFTGA